MERPTGTPRARARAAIVDELKAAARAQLAERGAAGLSVRHVARELGMSSSGVYRYFASRDELLTALIIDAYDALGDAVERAEAAVDRSDLFARWLAAATAVRMWAKANLQEYGLVYGSPVPGYVAPQDTVGPAARVPIVLAGILRDAYEARPKGAAPTTAHGSMLDATLTNSAAPLEGLPDDVITDGILAWVELFGAVTFELFGHLVGSVADPDAFFLTAVSRIGASLNVAERGTSTS